MDICAVTIKIMSLQKSICFIDKKLEMPHWSTSSRKILQAIKEGQNQTIEFLLAELNKENEK